MHVMCNVDYRVCDEPTGLTLHRLPQELQVQVRPLALVSMLSRLSHLMPTSILDGASL